LRVFFQVIFAGLRAAAVVDGAKGSVPAANREGALGDDADGQYVEVDAADAIVAGGEPGVGSDEGVVGVVDAEDVDIVITNVQMNKE